MNDLATTPYHACPYCRRELVMVVEGQSSGATAVVFRCQRHGTISWDKVRKLLRAGNTVLDPRGMRR